MKGKQGSGSKGATRSRLSLFNRRLFVKTASSAAAGVAVGFGAVPIRAEELARVDDQGAMAKALNYVHDAKTVDAAKRFSDRYCNNCALYDGSAEDEWAKCSIFPGKVVAGKGWCNAWAPKQLQ